MDTTKPIDIEKIKEQIQREQEIAAWRTLDVLTQFLLESRQYSMYAHVHDTPDRMKFVLIFTRDAGGTVIFHGQTLQDAYAQAAHTIIFNGGVLEVEE